MKSIVFCSVLLYALLVAPSCLSATDEDIDSLTTYATLLGRAIGCGIDTEAASKKVGTWIDRRFPPGSSGRQNYLIIFITGMKKSAKDQAAGRSPDSCAQIKQQYGKIPWP